MPEANDPTKTFLDATHRYQERLFDLWKVVFKKVKTMLKTMVSFVTNVISKAKELALVVGKAVIDKVVDFGSAVVGFIETIPITLKSALRLGKKIIALIEKATDPARIVSTLKKLFSRYMRQIREIYDGIVNFVSQLEILGTIFSVVSSFKQALRALFSWITDVTRANDGVVRAKRLLKKIIKQMRLEVKAADKLRKQVMKLKIAA